MAPPDKTKQITYGTTGGVLKPLEEVLLPDPRFQFFAMFSESTERPFQLSDIHTRLGDSVLNPGVPERVRVQFETARNLMLYSWCVFEFHTVSEMQAYAALEFALGERFQFPKRQKKTRSGVREVPLMLAELLQKAVREKAIIAEKLPAWERVKARQAWYEKRSSMPIQPIGSATEWLQTVIKNVPNFRNSLAHGETRLYLEASFSQLELCADLINALFPKPAE